MLVGDRAFMPPLPSDTETRIFEAALGAFARKGKDGARMQEIADAAGVNKAMLHYYFRSKDALYGRVFDYVLGQLVRAFGAALAHDGGSSFAATLRLFIGTYTDFVAAHTDVMRLMVNEMLSGGAAVREAFGRSVGEGFVDQLFGARVEAAVAKGEIRPVPPRHLLITVVSVCIFPFIAHPIVSLLMPEAETRRAAFLAERKEHLFTLLYDGLRPRPDEP
jgi:TetR/AcrR family transcriptional regulator